MSAALKEPSWTDTLASTVRATSCYSPYRYNETTTLQQDLNNYLGQLEDLSDEERFAPEPIEAIPDVPEPPELD